MSLPDIQNTKGDFKFGLVAGVEGLRVPIFVKTKDGGLTTTVADVDILVGLDRQQRGVNMSRLPAVVADYYSKGWIVDSFRPMLTDLIRVVESDRAHVRVHFPYFYMQEAPVTRSAGIAYVGCMLEASMCTGLDASYGLQLTVTVPVMTLCPCSKAISESSAHNQRAEVTMTVDYGDDFVWIEDLVEIANKNASCAVYPVLKRPDEKFVTEAAYNNPRFVEDVARGVAQSLHDDKRIMFYEVWVVSHESIHQHSAVAHIAEAKV